MVETDIVTGSFGYIGRYITRHLLEEGGSVRTITTHPDKPNPFGDQVLAYGLDFSRKEQLVESMRGGRCLYNTYWVRFAYDGMTFAQAVENTRILFECARQAGIEKIVHISVTRCDTASPLPYYSGKAMQEEALKSSGLPYAIVRPTLVFGKEDILVNNIAWLLRKFPVFPIFGSGRYRVQPVFVEDLARIAVNCSRETENLQVDAIGPEILQYGEMVSLLRTAVGSRSKMVHLPPGLGVLLGKLVGMAVRDVVLTRDEARGLMDEYLTSDQEPNGTVRFSEWITQNNAQLGQFYSSEIKRHFRWQTT